jgi:hypothetical protein
MAIYFKLPQMTLGQVFYITLFGIIISLRLIIHAFSTKTGIERVSG